MALSSCARTGLALAVLQAVEVFAQGAPTPPHVLRAVTPPSPFNVQSGGVAAFAVTVDETGSVAGVDTIQDVAPYGDDLRAALHGWSFEPAREQGRAVRSRVLLVAFLRPPELAVIAPERPRYLETAAPPDLPWPTSVTVPPYPPNALGSGKVILEADVTEEGKVTGARVLNPGSPFDGAATGAAQEWTFRPATRDGRPAAARVYFLFSFVGTTP
jgi:TonB family protein